MHASSDGIDGRPWDLTEQAGGNLSLSCPGSVGVRPVHYLLLTSPRDATRTKWNVTRFASRWTMVGMSDERCTTNLVTVTGSSFAADSSDSSVRRSLLSRRIPRLSVRRQPKEGSGKKKKKKKRLAAAPLTRRRFALPCPSGALETPKLVPAQWKHNTPVRQRP